MDFHIQRSRMLLYGALSCIIEQFDGPSNYFKQWLREVKRAIWMALIFYLILPISIKLPRYTSHLAIISLASVHDCIDALSLSLRSSIPCFCSADIRLSSANSLSLDSKNWFNWLSLSWKDFDTDSFNSFISCKRK